MRKIERSLHVSILEYFHHFLDDADGHAVALDEDATRETKGVPLRAEGEYNGINVTVIPIWKWLLQR